MNFQNFLKFVMSSAGAPLSAYLGFGSFHSDNFEDLIRSTGPVSDPPFPHDRPSKSPLFGLDPTFTFLNHGAFGAATLSSQGMARKWRERMELNPLRFVDRELMPNMAVSQRRLAGFLEVRPEDLAITQSATVGLNSVIASALRGCPDGALVLQLEIGYGAVKKMISGYAEREQRRGVGVVTCPVDFERYDDLVGQVERFMVAHSADRPIAVAVFDHITSNAGCELPIEALSRLCKARGVGVVIVDGAHGPGQVHPLGLPRLADVDAYVGNLHKWMCLPRGAAFVYVRPDGGLGGAGRVRSVITSHGSGEGLSSEFVFDGNRDYAAALSIPDAIDWFEADDGIAERNCVMAARAAELLTSAWGTDTLVHPCHYRSMVTVRLPELFPPEEPLTSAHAKTVQDRLHFDHKIEVPVKLISKKLYLRISAHVYNTIDHYQLLKNAVSSMAKERYC